MSGVENPLLQRVEAVRAELGKCDPNVLAARTAAAYISFGEGLGEFQLPMWGNSVRVSYPDFEASEGQTGQPCNPLIQAILAYYFSISDGTPLAGRWISFSELPDGRFYTQAFQGYTGHELAKTFGDNLDAFTAAAINLGGLPVSLGDRTYAFSVLPHVELLASAWLGDDDFPTSYKILLDAAISHHLTTDACAILGSTLTRKLIKASAG